MDKQDHKSRIGILGGSFNPAHEGHLEISKTALDFLDLDYIWWLVSPGNPLKNSSDLASFDQRMDMAKKIADDPRIIISDMERAFKTRYTVDTLVHIKKSHPEHHFVWLMGADNLADFHRWKDWQKIVEMVPFAIFNRPSYSKASLESKAARTLNEFRIRSKDAQTLHQLKPPAWVFHELTENPTSSTEIRSKIK